MLVPLIVTLIITLPFALITWLLRRNRSGLTFGQAFKYCLFGIFIVWAILAVVDVALRGMP